MFPWLGNAAATAQRRADLWRLLGPRPALDVAPHGELLRTSENATARVEHWALTLNTLEPVPALLLRPRDIPPRGLVLYCHAHGNRVERGKDELLLGRPALAQPPYGAVLPAMGYAVLAIDHWCFGERGHNSERALVKRLLWEGKTLWGYRVHDSLVALDWALAQPGLGGLPVTSLGLSMGSTMAVWCAALDERIAQCVDLCCLAEFDGLIRTGNFDLHGEYFFVPALLTEFTAAEIGALIAPRPHLSIAGRDDPLTPPTGLADIDAEVRAVYDALGVGDCWRQVVTDSGHEETAFARECVLQWFDRTPAS
ncbi:MAG: hypothetical protein JNL19_11015 [Burkholderiales bacterium]|nr:hypothetical protein [Burkholderiales bacterium]